MCIRDSKNIVKKYLLQVYRPTSNLVPVTNPQTTHYHRLKTADEKLFCRKTMSQACLHRSVETVLSRNKISL